MATATSTKRLYWLADNSCEATGIITALRKNWIALDQTCFFPGGGGQPADTGTIAVGGLTTEIIEIDVDDQGVFWHQCKDVHEHWLHQNADLRVNRGRRLALSRYHTALHVLNTIALQNFGARITGVQIAVNYARIDFKWDGFASASCCEIERKVNAELAANRRLRAYFMGENEFSQREDFLRTLDAAPPVIDGQVRIVEIEGFDAQACGGTHVSTTAEVGVLQILRTENKGKMNKRLYVKISDNDCAPQKVRLPMKNVELSQTTLT